jgi:hypothetical protein
MSIFDAIGDALGLNKGKATQAAAKQNMGVINALDPVGQGYLNTAKDNSQSYLDQTQTGATMYSNALGLNGAAGTQAAQDAFTSAPGYDYTLNSGLDAVMRKASAMGRVGSGNTSADLVGYATNEANKNYGSWLDRIGGYMSSLGGATAGANQSLGALTDWAGGIASAKMGANNQTAAGKEAGQGWLADPLLSIGKQMAFGYGQGLGMKG